MLPKYIRRGEPSWFLNMPPNPALLGLPFEAPSKLSLKVCLGGGVQEWFLMLLPSKCLWLWVPCGSCMFQFSQMAFSFARVGKYWVCQVFSTKVSLRLRQKLLHMISKGVLWSLKMRLFRSFHIVQRRRPGIILHNWLINSLLYGFWCQLRMELIYLQRLYIFFDNRS